MGNTLFTAPSAPAPSKISIEYFDIKAKGEPLRLCLAVGKVKFDDVRVQFSDWKEGANKKSQTRWGVLPEATIDGKTFGQSNALLRYFGRVTGLYPTDALAALAVDEIVDAVDDVRAAVRPSFAEKDEEKKAEMRKELAETRIPELLGMFEKRLAENGASGDRAAFFVGPSITIADLNVYVLLGWLRSGILDGIPTTVVDGFPQLVANANMVAEHPGVQAWENNRSVEYE